MNSSIRNIRCAIFKCATLVFVLTASTVHAITAPSSLVVFGDSLSDTGNRFALEGGNFPGAPYFNGQFSNGPTYAGVLADSLGVSSLNSLAGGTNYAVGGAEINTYDGSLTPPTTGATVVPPLTRQVDTFLESTNGVADPEALYVVLGGGNDLRTLAAGGTIDISQSASSLAGIVSDLSDAGANNILVSNLPNLGLTPEAQAGGENGAALATAITVLLNNEIESALGDLELELDANVMMFDLFGVTNEIVSNPGAFGLSNATDACFQGATGAVCANPDEYFFWDQFHPSAATHEIIAARIEAQVVPIPGALLLMLSALAGLGLTARRKKGRS